jgi:hypothetical protein
MFTGAFFSQAVATASISQLWNVLRGAARFNYGSTVVVLLPPGVAELVAGLGT